MRFCKAIVLRFCSVDMRSLIAFRKFREAMCKLQEETVQPPKGKVKPFETDNEYHKPLYAMVNLVVAQQQAFVDAVHGDNDAESV